MSWARTAVCSATTRTTIVRIDLLQKSRNMISSKQILVRTGLRHILRRRGILLHIFVVPGQVALVTIAHIARPRDAVKLIRIDDQLGFDAETAQRLIHLLAALDRHVEIALATEKQGGRLDAIGVQERI